jgi:poly(3-hydroxybutyrate) depolymerase
MVGHAPGCLRRNRSASKDRTGLGSRTWKLIRTTFLLLPAVAISGALVVVTPPSTAMGNGQAFQYEPGATSRNSLESAGKRRQFLVHIPASYRPGDVLPLILNFHGYESSASQQEDISEMSVLSESEGFIVVYPEGLGHPQA